MPACATAMIWAVWSRPISTGNALPLGKIVVLVDGGTASAAELLAGSLQDTGSATLIGSKTYGKGQGQFHIDLVNGDKLVITTLELELPKQGCWEGVGLTPDIQLENRKVTVNTKDLKPLDTSTTPAFWRQLGRGLRHDRAPVAAGTAHRSNRQV